MVSKIQSNVPFNYASGVTRIDSKPEVLPSSTSQTSKTADVVSLSEDARILQRATQAASNASTVRGDVIQSIQSQLKAGSYQIDAENIAEKLLSILM
jgi:flagellar biosynthesis anti-sigma factor FlgM